MTVPGAPDHELSRSPAAARVGALAAQSGLRLAHWEHRVQLEAPTAWEPIDRPDLGVQGPWRDGVLPETKFRTFRLDQRIGSFNPTHRAKWTAHELMHGLVGFAWRPDGTALFHATAARVAELLPVALWYFFDEAHLARCADHAGQGPLFGTWCAACERAAADGPLASDADAERRTREGRAFVARELDAAMRSLESGRPIPSRWATIDLCSDGLAYAAAHMPRMADPVFARWVEAFHAPGQGHHADLAALCDRVRALTDDLCGGPAAPALRGDAALWAAQDVGFRLATVEALLTELGAWEPAAHVRGVAEHLAADPTQTGLTTAIAGYTDLADTYELPEPDEVFAVGYGVPDGHGSGIDQLVEGVHSALPETADLVDGPDLWRLVRAFSTADRWQRRPLAHRFADWLSPVAPAVADVARLEAAVRHAAPADLGVLTLWAAETPAADDRVQLATGVGLVTVTHDVTGLVDPAEPLDPQPLDTPEHYVVHRAGGGGVGVGALDDAAAAALAQLEQGPLPADALGLDADALQTLVSLGLIVPAAWLGQLRPPVAGTSPPPGR